MPTSVKFGGKDYDLPELFILSELRDISIICSRKRPDSAEEVERQMFETSAEIFVAALKRRYPEINYDFVMCAETTIVELIACRLMIMKQAGLIPDKGKEVRSGEGVAAA